MYAMLFKGGIQRTYVPRGDICPKQTKTGTSSLTMTHTGIMCLNINLYIQAIISFFCVCSYGIWFFSPYPLGPAIRVTHDYIYFITLLAPTQMTTGLYELGNTESSFIWQELDIFGRIGEAVHTVGAPTGRIVLDRPKLVRPLENGRRYH